MTARLRPGGHLSGEQRRHLVDLTLSRLGGASLSTLSSNERLLLRDVGYMEETTAGRRYVSGRALHSTTAEMNIKALLDAGHDVRHHLHVWTAAQKRICRCWFAVQKYIDNTFGLQTPGVKASLSNPQLQWLRNYTVAHPKRCLKELRLDLFARTRVILSVSSISRILRASGLSRQVVRITYKIYKYIVVVLI